MASPQLEDGFARIANSILDAVSRTGLNGAEYATIIVLWRYTYGFSRKSCPLSASFIAKATCCSERTIKRALKNLIARKIIRVENPEQKGVTQILSFGKNYDSWEGSAVSDTSDIFDTSDKDDTGLVTELSPELVTELSPKKRNRKKYKKNICAPDGSRDSASEGVTEPEQKSKRTELEMDRSDFEQIYAVYPKKRGKSKAFEHYRAYVGKGRVIGGVRYKLTPEQIYNAVLRYTAEREQEGTELQFYQNADTFFNRTVLDYLDGEEAG